MSSAQRYPTGHGPWIECRWADIMGFSRDKQPVVRHVSNRVVLGFGCNGMELALSAEIAARTADLLLAWGNHMSASVRHRLESSHVCANAVFPHKKSPAKPKPAGHKSFLGRKRRHLLQVHAVRKRAFGLRCTLRPLRAVARADTSAISATDRPVLLRGAATVFAANGNHLTRLLSDGIAAKPMADIFGDEIMANIQSSISSN
jgi:hypothetical protein